METSEPPGNPGIILLHPLAVPTPEARTIIVTGVGRSGTSMAAALLAGAGILDRANAYDVTLEDRELLHILTTQDRPGLIEAIRRRNEDANVWAFKIPNLHGYLTPADLSLFRNPHLVIVMRGIAAIAHRHATAERLDPARAFFETAETMTTLVEFLRSVDCPTLVVSYEKPSSTRKTARLCPHRRPVLQGEHRWTCSSTVFRSKPSAPMAFEATCATPVSATAVMALISIPPLQSGPRSYPRRARLRPHFPAPGQRPTHLALCALKAPSAGLWVRQRR